MAVRKLALWVCPMKGCRKVSWKIHECPDHPGKTFVRRVYVKEDETMEGSFQGNDTISKLFRGMSKP